jgi:hypothetical protein
VAEFKEIESGKHSDHPALAKAFQACRLRRAKLIIAKLDRPGRDAHFLLGLEKAGVDFMAADMPTANRLTVGILTMVADEERRMISKRTKEELAAAKVRGVKLGGNRAHHLGRGERDQQNNPARHLPGSCSRPCTRCSRNCRRPADELRWTCQRANGAGYPNSTRQGEVDPGSGRPRLGPARDIGGRVPRGLSYSAPDRATSRSRWLHIPVSIAQSS